MQKINEIEGLVISFLEHDPGRKCENRREECSNEAVWEIVIHAWFCSCSGPMVLCDPCNTRQEDAFREEGSRDGLCNAHLSPCSVDEPRRYRK